MHSFSAYKIILVVVLNCCFTIYSSVRAQILEQKMIDDAMRIPLIFNTCGPDINTELWTKEVIGKDKALFLLSLSAYLNPELTNSEGKLVRNRVVAHLRNIISLDSAGRSLEPSGRGDLAGWKDVGQAFALVFTKRTPKIWKQFSKAEKLKFDWIMRAFAITGNYHANIKNWPSRCTYQTYGIGKTWNPNHNDGNVALMIAAYYYFGGANEVNKILNEFNYNHYLSTFRKLRFYNIVETWSAASTKKYPEGKDEEFMKNLLENPQSTVQNDKGGGRVYGARMPFVFGAPPKATQEVPYNPIQLYKSIATWMFPHLVTNASRTGVAFTMNGASSPMLGKLGMCREFQVLDGFIPNVNERSDARYAWWGWMMHVPIVASMMALGDWPQNGEMSDTESRMYVGSEDLMFKLRNGYHSFSLKKHNEYFDSMFAGQGYWFVVGIWNGFIKKRMHINPDSLKTETDLEAKKTQVLEFLHITSGKKTLSGQHNERFDTLHPFGRTDSIYKLTGKYPALFGIDFSYDYRTKARWQMIYEAEKQWNKGALINIMWHACIPTIAEPCVRKEGIETKISDIAWKELITDGTTLNRKLKLRFDEISVYLAYLQSKGVVVLWRPWHEMNQSVFWWGGRPGENGTRKLFQLTHDYFENVKGLKNLIWVWDVQDLSWDFEEYNPGDKYWDVLAFDIYDKDNYTNQKYETIQKIAGSKPIAVGECAILPSQEEVTNQSAWLFFMSWADLVFKKNKPEEILRLYNHPNVLTLDEMPCWK